MQLDYQIPPDGSSVLAYFNGYRIGSAFITNSTDRNALLTAGASPVLTVPSGANATKGGPFTMVSVKLDGAATFGQATLTINTDWAPDQFTPGLPGTGATVIPSSSAWLTANVALPGATATPILSLPLASGTWLVVAQLVAEMPPTQIAWWLQDGGGAHLADGLLSQASAVVEWVNATLTALLTLDSTTNITLTAQPSSSTFAFADVNGTGANRSTGIVAVKLA